MARTIVNLKQKMLALLKEDKEFRYTVIGLLGIEDLRSGQVRLENGLAKLEETQARLQEAIEKLTESHNKLIERHVSLEKTVERLTERQGALEGAFQKLAERHDILEKAVEKLTESHNKLVESHNKLIERHDILEKTVEKLTESHNKLVERHDSLEKAIERLTEAQARTENALQELFKQVGKLSETIGFGLEDIARVVIPGWLYKHEKIEVEEFTRKFIIIDGEEIEINLYGEGRKEGAKIIILGEVRSRIYLNDVERFSKIVEKIKKKIEGNTYELMFGYYIHPSAEEEAKKKKISLIASYMR
jgi:DNA repair exonuclease SbcCD ATPase subunit